MQIKWPALRLIAEGKATLSELKNPKIYTLRQCFEVNDVLNMQSDIEYLQDKEAERKRGKK